MLKENAHFFASKNYIQKLYYFPLKNTKKWELSFKREAQKMEQLQAQLHELDVDLLTHEKKSERIL